MGSLCPCPWGRKKKVQFAYDVHQQTFQMDENIGDLDIPKSSKDRPPFSSEANMMENEKQHQSQQNQKKYIESKIKQDQNPLSPQNVAQDNNEMQAQNQDLALIDKAEQEMPQPQVKPIKLVQSFKDKPKYNPEDYRFLKEEDQFKVKKINSIRMQQFNIDACKNSFLFIFDITANVYIDDCQNCTIFIAPCQSTIFVRNCKNMEIIAACKQFRTYQCHNCKFSLYCKSQPVIESSSELIFSSFQCPVYSQLVKQFEQAKLEIWNNHWSEIHNFTKKGNQQDYQLTRYSQFQRVINWKKAFTDAELQMKEGAQSIVPFIEGAFQQQTSYQNRALILVKEKASPNPQEVLKIVNYNDIGVRIMKAFYGKVAGMGKKDVLAILLEYEDMDFLDGAYSFAEILTEEEQIKSESNKYFITFSDER